MTAPVCHPIRPAVLPAYGQETAVAVLAIVEGFPELHDQEDWERSMGRGCQTTRCVAGWAQWLHTGRVSTYDGDDTESVEEFGQQALGLSCYDATRLFYDTTNEQARNALRQIAQGASIIDWETVPGYFDNMDGYE